jgi:hypothetical protein
MTPLYKKVEQFVKESFKKAGKPQSFPHLKRTAYWIKQLKPDANEALLIAGVSHDIERAIYGNWVKGSLDKQILQKHMDQSAQVITSFLKEEKVDNDLIELVIMLIANHEFGGNDSQNLLKDADSISFLENNANNFINNLELDKEEVRNKFDHTYKRITSPIARKIAKPMYQDAIKKLALR